MHIRAVHKNDQAGIWRVLEPAVRAGETFALPRTMSEPDAIAYWCAPLHSVFVAEEGAEIVGSYFLRANQIGGGSHVANAGYVSHPASAGRGIARALCEHSIEQARALGFRAMQFNFVVRTNERAVRLWQSLGFAIVGQLPGAFAHPQFGDVDVFVMFRKL
jgi:L-amino acid N-acyltransferase YncA